MRIILLAKEIDLANVYCTVQEIVPSNFPEYSLMIKHCYVKVNVHRNLVTRLSVFITVSLVDNALGTFVYYGYNFCQNIRIKEI